MVSDPATADEKGLSARSSIDDITDLYKKEVDRTLLREALKMTPGERVRKLAELVRFGETMREAGKKTFR